MRKRNRRIGKNEVRMTTTRLYRRKLPYRTPRRIKRVFLSDEHLGRLRQSIYAVLEQWPTESMYKGRYKPRKLRAVWSAELDQDIQAMYDVRAEGVLVDALRAHTGQTQFIHADFTLTGFDLVREGGEPRQAFDFTPAGPVHYTEVGP